MKRIIIGTAGHVDHGKTTLIKALTGIDTDRLKEEKERGMTIDLGFAMLNLPNGLRVGIVDVPGHERFIKNMLAGAGGVDVALMVIAANESVMPQTMEHLDILRLLDVKHGVIALTKVDLVEPEFLEIVKEDICSRLANTFLEDAQIIPVSVMTNVGIPELLSALEDVCSRVPQRDSLGPFRVPIDRVFTVTGFGTVVTGTLVSGTVRTGDAAEILPKGINTRIRGIQVHGQKVEAAEAGSRVALNLAGVELPDIERGDVCATPGILKASKLLDLKLTLLKNIPKPLANRARVRFHIGTAEVIGRIVLLDRDEVGAGEEAFAQFRAETPVVAMKNDRFVIRTYSPMLTIGGGIIIESSARRHKRFDESVIALLEETSSGTPFATIEQILKRADAGITPAEIIKSSELTSLDIQELLEKLKAAGHVIELESGRLFHASVIASYADKIYKSLVDYHSRHALKLGMQKEELRRTACKLLDNKTFTALLTKLMNEGKINMSEALISLPDYSPKLNSKQQAACEFIISELRRTGLNAPSDDELLQGTGLPIVEAKEIMELLVHRGEVIKITDGLYLHPSVVSQAEKLIREYLEKNGKLTVAQARDILGSSRKYIIPLMEYFDKKRITRRLGDERILLKEA
ncbi:MAG: selenocysteine-specific translation elongation factor [Armatimonadetes bacterium]|nr:selenocysteine-specific translation elongation factor [Armatimonadota bacterium]